MQTMNSDFKFLQQRRTNYIEMLVVSKQKNVYYYIIGLKKTNQYISLFTATSLRMLKNRIRQTPRNLTSSIIQDGIESQINIKNPTQSATWGCNDKTTSEG